MSTSLLGHHKRTALSLLLVFISLFSNVYQIFAGCIFIGGSGSRGGLMSFDHPLNKVRGIVREDDDGNVSGVIFQVDLLTRLPSIPRSGSAANWANAAVVEGEF